MTAPAHLWSVVGAAPATVLLVAAGEDELRPGLDPRDVGPGFLGFVVVFAMVLACIPLFRSLTGKLRGVEHRGVQDGRVEDGRVEDGGATSDDGASDGGAAPDGGAGDDPGRAGPAAAP